MNDYLELIWSGSRRHPNLSVVIRELERQRRQAWDAMCRLFVAVGDCPTGVDATVHTWCRINLREQDWAMYRADWKRLRNAAGPTRNRDMIKAHPNAKGLLAFPLRGQWVKSKGTWDCVAAAVDAGLPVVIVPPDAPRFTLTTIPEAKEAMR